MNGYLILDMIRRTKIVEKRDYYLQLFNDPDIHRKALGIQKDKLIHFIKRLRSNSFYNNYLTGISDNDIDNCPYEVLKSFPISDKTFLSNNYQQIRNPYYKGESCYTGGSTGSPFHYFAGKEQLSSTIGFTMFLWTYLGNYDWKDSVIVVGGASIGDKQSIRKRVLHHLQGRTYVSGGEINQDNALRLSRLINHARYPVVLYGYPSSICQYLLLFEELSLPIETNNIKTILTTSETLTNEKKGYLESFFQKDVINLYGARDGGISAGSKDNRVFIYNGIDCVAESIDIDGTKELVLTNLDSDAFPFVRYRNGDIANTSLSLDGYPFLLTDLQGRTRDFIHISRSNKVHGSQINKIFKDYPVIEYQILQHKDYSCDIRIQTSRDISNGDITSLTMRFKHLLGDIPFHIIVVERLERGKNNKLRNVISEVN